MMRAALLLVVAGCGSAGAPDSETAQPLPPPGRRIAIYSEGGAIVVDRRWIELPAGESRIALGDLAATIVPASLTMRALGPGGGLDVRERTFDPGLARSGSAGTILAESIGREVEIVRRGERLRGKLTAVRGGEIVVASGGSLVTVPWQDADVLAVGGRRRAGRPALVARVRARRAGRRLVELVYAAGGLSFAASYAIRVHGASAEVRPSAQVENQSGLDLGGARLALYSGRLGAGAEEERPALFWTGAIELAGAPGRGESRQLAFPAAHVPIRIESVYRGALPDTSNPPGEPAYGTQMQQTVVRHLLLDGARGLPAVLPPGSAVVELDSGERLATRLAERVAAGGAARFELDAERLLFGDRRQVRVDRSPDGHQLTESYDLTVRNTGTAAARVRVVEPLTRSRRAIINRSEPPPASRKDRTLEWLIDVPPRGEAKVSYEATYRF